MNKQRQATDENRSLYLIQYCEEQQKMHDLHFVKAIINRESFKTKYKQTKQKNI